MSDHKVTCTDERVRGYWGTVARCICGWSDAWMLQGGNAESSGHSHMMENDPEYSARHEERMWVWAAEQVERDAQREAEHLIRLENTPLGPETKPFEPCHQCSCHLNPPCSNCENCAHASNEITDCDNDCDSCDIDHFN